MKYSSQEHNAPVKSFGMLASSLSERRRNVSIADLECQIQAKRRQKFTGNRQIWQYGIA